MQKRSSGWGSCESSFLYRYTLLCSEACTQSQRQSGAPVTLCKAQHSDKAGWKKKIKLTLQPPFILSNTATGSSKVLLPWETQSRGCVLVPFAFWWLGYSHALWFHSAWKKAPGKRSSLAKEVERGGKDCLAKGWEGRGAQPLEEWAEGSEVSETVEMEITNRMITGQLLGSGEAHGEAANLEP